MRRLAPALAVLLATSCSLLSPRTHPAAGPPRGGTLRVASSPAVMNPDQTMLDPQLDAGGALEAFRCCLARTLLSYEGKPTGQGGTKLRPDLAEALPTISPDGLTWTFHLRAGVHYSPPYQRYTVTAQDFVRTLARVALVGTQAGPQEPGSSYESVIVGFDDYVNGKATSITGVETPDARTLVFHLTGVDGDFAYRLAQPNLGPIPPGLHDPNAPLGAEQGHDAGDGGFLVSTGPYMVEGVPQVDFTQPPAAQKPAAGWVAGKSVTLVRNPSWSAANDPLRPAYVDRIVITLYGSPDSDVATQADAEVQAVQAGQADLELIVGGALGVRSDIIQAHRAQVRIDLRSDIRYISMNLGVPPFDDVHVRKAVNLIVDKAAVRDALGGPFAGQFASHIGPDSLEENALTGYQPYPSVGGAGDLAAAQKEMEASAYDPAHDGKCDVAACRHVTAIVLKPRQAQGDVIKADLAKIGISLDVQVLQEGDFFAAAGDPTRHIGLTLMTGWGADFPDGSNFFVPLFRSNAIPNAFNALIGPPIFNTSLLGASPADLAKWGYPPSAAIPNVDDRIDECLASPGWEQTPCWVRVDEYLMEKVVPWVPVIYEFALCLVAPNVVQYSFDQTTTQPALDQISLKTAKR